MIDLAFHRRLTGAADQNHAKTDAPQAQPDAEAMSLEELFRYLEQFGTVFVWANRPDGRQHGRAYVAWVDFNTLAGTKLEAKGADNTLRGALIEAIRNADLIRGQFK